MINLEKLQRAPDKPVSVSGGASSPACQEVLKAVQEQSKTKVTASNPYVIPDSDHYPFGASRIPSLMLFVNTSIDMHQLSDSSGKIDFVRTAEAANYAMAMLWNVSNRDKRPEYAASPVPDLGLIAHLITNAGSFSLRAKHGQQSFNHAMPSCGSINARSLNGFQ